MNKLIFFLCGLTISLLLTACGSSEPPPDVEQTVATAVAATVAALPAQPVAEVPEATPYPTYTPYPTFTPPPTEEAVATEIVNEPTTEIEPTEEPPQPTSPPEPAPVLPTDTPVPSQPVEIANRAGDGAAMVFVPAGEFLMGATDADLSTVGAGGPPKLAGGDEQPQHTVSVDAFWIDQTEITNARFSNFVNLTGYKTTAELEGHGTSLGEQIDGATFYHPQGIQTGIDDKQNHPVVQVSWQDAKTYCEWTGARLPTEAEWEKAAKGAANDRIFPWGNAFQLPEFDVSNVANFCSNSCVLENKDVNVDDGFPFTAPVGSFPAGASPYGALDMAGNVWEWVESSYLGYPGNSYEQQEDFNEYFKVVRGGSWDNAAQHLRATFRQNNEPHLRSDGTGFRCAVSANDFQPAELPAEAESVVEPTSEPTTEPTAEPTVEATIEPTSEPTSESVPESTSEPTAEPTTEPTTEPNSGG